MKIIYFTIFIVFLSSLVFGQQPSTSPSPLVSELTDESIIEMAEAKIPDSVIISKIEVSKTRFKTEIADLKTLTEKGVSEAVISAMVKKAQMSQNLKKMLTTPAIIPNTGTCLKLPEKQTSA